MANRRRAATLQGLGIATVLGLLMDPGSAAAQDAASRTYSAVGVLGDIEERQTPNPGRVHLFGTAGFSTADYSRGEFDDVPEGLDEIATTAGAAATFALWRDLGGVMRDVTLTLGTDQGWADQVQPTDGSPGDWYESNFYAGVAAGVGRDWTWGLTYSVFTSPNDVSPEGEELALAARYDAQTTFGGLSPQAKIAAPIDGGDGVYTEIRVTPTVTFRQDTAVPVDLEVPVTLGVGFDDYYGAASSTTGFLGLGVNASVPLTFIASDYGSWSLVGGLDFLWREDDLAEADEPFGDDDTLVTVGSVRVQFAY